MRILTLIFGLMLTAVVAFPQANWSFDKVHSNITFNVEHLVISEVTGSFGTFDGKVQSGAEGFDGSKVEFTVDVASVTTDNEKRDGHLKSDDFFNAEKFPQIKFTNGTLKHVEGNQYMLTGDLTIRDVTKPVELEVKHGGIVKDQYGNTKAGFKITGEVNRFDYNMKFDDAMEAGGLVVGEAVEIVCNVQLQKKS